MLVSITAFGQVERGGEEEEVQTCKSVTKRKDTLVCDYLLEVEEHAVAVLEIVLPFTFVTIFIGLVGKRVEEDMSAI